MGMTSESRGTQVRKMLAFAAEHGSITNFDAVYRLGILSPTRRICDIKALGYTGAKVREAITDASGAKKHVVRYTITKEETAC